ncbi:MAG: hypothetical protein HWN65_09255 [Candidatus Helarchaeota archaeon]|nr:hypothetical protein [Candidatus Helarchaeota archaeon]
MKEDDPLLWEGTTSLKWKKELLIWGFFLIILLFTLIPYFPLIIIIGIYAGHLILPVSILMFSIFLVIDAIVQVLRYRLDRYPQYFVTSKYVIKKGRFFFGWGKLKTTSWELGHVQHVLIIGGSFNFFKTKCDDSEDFAAFYMRTTSVTFDSIDAPDALLNVLQSVIPLRKEHPCSREYASISRYDRAH